MIDLGSLIPNKQIGDFLKSGKTHQEYPVPERVPEPNCGEKEETHDDI
jgi:hypothetical protein